MTSDQEPTYRELTLRMLNQLEVPDNQVRRLALELAELIEDPDTDAGVMSIAAKTSQCLHEQLREYYRPRTAAEAEIEYLDALLTLTELKERGEI